MLYEVITDHSGPRHRDRPPVVLQTVAGLVLDGRMGGPLLPHLLGESSPLDHESPDHPVKNQPVVIAFFP